MKEQLITFETAKLAKEAGFDTPCTLYNAIDNEIECFTSIIPRNWNNASEWISICSQSLLQKWLRETHNCHLFIIPVGDSTFKLKYYCYGILSVDTEEGTHNINRFLTYEEALEEGLQYTLKLICHTP
jgi:hypothetical protein